MTWITTESMTACRVDLRRSTKNSEAFVVSLAWLLPSGAFYDKIIFNRKTADISCRMVQNMKDIGKIDRNIVARYIGMKGNAPEGELIGLMDKAEKLLYEDMVPAQIYKRFDLSRQEEGIALMGASLTLPGKDIEKLLENCDMAVLLCATLGPKVDARIRKLSAYDVAMALVYDATASVAIDNICDKLQSEIAEKLPGYDQTMRFSPGYGDLPLELQERFINVLDTKKRVGVSLTEGGMLTPVKTVTAVVGLRKKNNSEIQEKDCESKITEEAEGNSVEETKRGCGLAITCRECSRKDSCSMAVL